MKTLKKTHLCHHGLLVWMLFHLIIGVIVVSCDSHSKNNVNVPFEISSDVDEIYKVTDIDGKTFYFLNKDRYIGGRYGYFFEVRLKEVDGTEKIWNCDYDVSSDYDAMILKFTDTQLPPIMFKGGMFKGGKYGFNWLILRKNGTLDAGTWGPGGNLEVERIYQRDYFMFGGEKVRRR